MKNKLSQTASCEISKDTFFGLIEQWGKSYTHEDLGVTYINYRVYETMNGKYFIESEIMLK